MLPVSQLHALLKCHTEAWLAPKGVKSELLSAHAREKGHQKGQRPLWVKVRRCFTILLRTCSCLQQWIWGVKQISQRYLTATGLSFEGLLSPPFLFPPLLVTKAVDPEPYPCPSLWGNVQKNHHQPDRSLLLYHEVPLVRVKYHVLLVRVKGDGFHFVVGVINISVINDISQQVKLLPDALNFAEDF